MDDTIKVLLAEDSKGYLQEWIDGLQGDGFDLGGKDADQLIEEAKTGIAKLTLGMGEIHITSSAPVADRAFQDHTYQMCFMDGILLDGNTYDTVTRLLRAPSSPFIYLISKAVNTQVNILQAHAKMDVWSLLKTETRILGTFKDYHCSRRNLSKLFGFVVPEPYRPTQKMRAEQPPPPRRLILPRQPILVLCTRNAGKLSELQEMLSGRFAEIIDLTALENRLALPVNTLGDIPELGISYEENADLKAKSVAAAIRQSDIDDKARYVVIADDSGLEVSGAFWSSGSSLSDGQSERLVGQPFPGVDTHQFAETMGSPERECAFYNKISDETRNLQAITALAVRLATDGETELSYFFRGAVSGTLAPTPRGENGFGYDPFFIPGGHALTFAQIPPKAKNAMSHRRKAFQAMLREISGKGHQVLAMRSDLPYAKLDTLG